MVLEKKNQIDATSGYFNGKLEDELYMEVPDHHKRRGVVPDWRYACCYKALED